MNEMIFRAKYELRRTDKLVYDAAYTANMTEDEKMDIEKYRTELVSIVNGCAIAAETKIVFPQRPSWADKYL